MPDPPGPTAPPARRRATAAARERDALRALLASIGHETELEPLLQRLLEQACARVGADYGGIALLTEDGEALRVAASRGLPTSLVGVDLPADDGFAGEVLRRRAPLRLRRYADARPDPAYPEFGDDAVVGIPILRHEALLGVLSLARRPRGDGDPRPRARAFTAAEVRALASFAADAAIAVANVRRLALERSRADRLALLAHVGRLVTADLHLADLLQRSADAIHELLGYDNVAIALLAPADPALDPPGVAEVLDLRHFGGAYKRAIGGAHRIPIGEGLMGAAARTRAVILVNDAGADPRYLPTPGTAGRHAELVLPLLLGGEVLGVLNVERRAPFGADDVEHLRVVADQLAVAVENARLYDVARQAAVLEERHRLARELHDSVTQQLFTAAMVAQGVGRPSRATPPRGPGAPGCSSR